MTLAILCSGQGRQHPGMFVLTGHAPAAAFLFAHAATLLGGRDPREIVRTETSEALHHNRISQILCTLQALAAATALRDALPDRLIVAGYSVGEVAAWGVAGLLDMTDALDLVAQRAEIMDAASPPGDGLLFVRGLSRDAIDGLCARHDAAVAIVNPGDAFVIGGNGVALGALSDEAKALNAARVVRVPVEVASHTKRLAAASPAFRDSLGKVAPGHPRTGTRLLSGIDGAPVLDVASGLDKLAAQISQTVRWAACLQGCIEGGATAFLELGPGPALSEMAAGAYPGTPARSLDDFRTLQGASAWLARYAPR
ncbi:acyltransferase domain-containing protein [Bosea caraganae]|uniref:Acyltransferase domain-containing protein n=1 Tax=Bosea caraganae TaxID=2763117 RepID=A0A370L9W1_9HYPH|nr:acyltransferase domain-containing protein [Bosea caraganae]RDJ21875.1 acyltransferase domain-containing protein [Bosea caraganae]RDJ28093.1 acyltransferase domain-containing protein [Bosea caraganae]